MDGNSSHPAGPCPVPKVIAQLTGLTHVAVASFRTARTQKRQESRFATLLSPAGSGDHLSYGGISVNHLKIYCGMRASEDPEDLIGESLADRFHAGEVQNDGAEDIHARQDASGLRARNQRIP